MACATSTAERDSLNAFGAQSTRSSREPGGCESVSELQTVEERDVARLEHRNRLADDVLLEVRSLPMGLVSGLVPVHLVEKEEPRICDRSVGLVDQAARLVSRWGRHGLDDSRDVSLLPLMGPP